MTSSRGGGADVSTRVVDAVLELAALTGLRKLSMDEVARHARVGRATLYTHFPGRDALLAAAVTDALGRFAAAVATVVAEYDDHDDRLVHGFARGYRYLRDDAALQTILRVNPEILLPYVISGSDAPLDTGRGLIRESLRLDDLDDAAQDAFGEHVARLLHSLMLVPATVNRLDDPDGPERYARVFLVPVKHGLARNRRRPRRAGS